MRAFLRDGSAGFRGLLIEALAFILAAVVATMTAIVVLASL